ncbi:unnamed protein product [Spirodela intermedia]|uniref:Uncharacterized protein n=1 Tax=Spirodela intermedia TaxID=51605 RepID=A0A7I8J1K5_SPIIN|nr:unnamed protein product [Spirodela intermedia]CAA6663281.1 unnamed protein product [Spirodela intermedia]
MHEDSIWPKSRFSISTGGFQHPCGLKEPFMIPWIQDQVFVDSRVKFSKLCGFKVRKSHRFQHISTQAASERDQIASSSSFYCIT